jgi:hypothetical protein
LGVTGGVGPAHGVRWTGPFHAWAGPESERHVARKFYERALIAIVMAVFTIAALLVIDLLTAPTMTSL